MESNINTKDISKLLKLFHQLGNLISPKLPEKDKKLWEESQNISKKELIEQLKKRQEGFTIRSSRNVTIGGFNS